MSAINSAAEVSPAQPMRWRLRQQYPDKSAPDPVEVASRLGGIHAQVMSSAVKIRSGWGVMLKPAAAGGLLCFGPDRDRNVTFTDPRSHLLTLSWATLIRTSPCARS